MCKWSYDIVDHFGFEREVVYISLSYLDRHIAKLLHIKSQQRYLYDRSRKSGRFHDFSLEYGINPEGFKLLGMTSLFVAVKIHGHCEEYDVLTSTDFASLSRGAFTEKDLEDMEMTLLSSLNWLVNPPTPVNFLVYFLHSIQVDTKTTDQLQFSQGIKMGLYELARYFLELATSVYDLSVRQRPSCVALASLHMALDAMSDEYIPRDLGQSFLLDIWKVTTDYHEEEVRYVKILIQDVCNDALSSSQISIHISDILASIKCDEKTKNDINGSPVCVSKSD